MAIEIVFNLEEVKSLSDRAPIQPNGPGWCHTCHNCQCNTSYTTDKKNIHLDMQLQVDASLMLDYDRESRIGAQNLKLSHIRSISSDRGCCRQVVLDALLNSKRNIYFKMDFAMMMICATNMRQDRFLELRIPSCLM